MIGAIARYEAVMPGSAAPAPRGSRSKVGGGRVLMWRGGSLWVSRDTGLVQPHAHHAIQVTLAPRQPVKLRSEDGATWVAAHASIVMPDREHQFDGCGQDVAILLLEPETKAGRMLLARYGQASLTVIPDDAVNQASQRLLDGLASRASDATLVESAQAIVGLLAGHVPEVDAVDPRITRALDWIRGHLDGPITLGQVAGVAHLSPSRFRHLFVAQTGISFRAYVLWSRVSAGMVAAMAGQSWTEAAQNAGFADSAHFTRTCRRMFGISPTMLDRGKPAAPGG